MPAKAKVANKTTKQKAGAALHNFAGVLPYILIIGGVIGLLMSAILTYDHDKLALNPNYIPNCNLNPIIACGDVIKSKQAEAFHIPNPYVGLVAFPVVIALGVVVQSGARLKRWLWLGLEAGTLFGVGFMHWLFYETVYRIHALCPYCMVTWVVMITMFWYVTLYNLQAGNINAPATYKKYTDFLVRHHVDILVLWLLIIAALILKHFWYYYGHYL